jgi:hypothetical protein
MIQTYRARYRLQMAPGVWREPTGPDGLGELVPEAHTWFRVDSWLHQGQITEAEVSEEDFRAAVEKYCPDLAERIYELVGLGDNLVSGVREIPHVKPKAPARKRVAKGAPVPVEEG